VDKNPAGLDGSAPATATKTYATTLAIAANNQYAVAVFTTGFVGQMNPFFFYGNVSYTVPTPAAGVVSVVVTVHA